MTSYTPLISTTHVDARDLEQASFLDADAEALGGQACAVCPHSQARHDAISARYCSATGVGAIARGCICRS